VTTFASTLNSPAEQRHIERLIVETFDATLVEGVPSSVSSRTHRAEPLHSAPPSASVVQKLWED
jgi:hypothetical protein